jgi:hypothetical protein
MHDAQKVLPGRPAKLGICVTRFRIGVTRNRSNGGTRSNHPNWLTASYASAAVCPANRKPSAHAVSVAAELLPSNRPGATGPQQFSASV